MLYAKLIGRIALFTCENIAHIEFYLQGLLPKILAIYTKKNDYLLHVKQVKNKGRSREGIEGIATPMHPLNSIFSYLLVSSLKEKKIKQNKIVLYVIDLLPLAA